MSAREAETRYTSAVTAYNYLHSENGEHYLEITFVPSVLTGDGYREALLGDQLTLRLFWNSVLLAVPILLGQLIVSPLAAFAFEMARFRGKEFLYFLYIIVMLMPLQLLMVPHYIAAETLGYNNTYWAIILPGIFAPFGTFLLRQQMKGLDRSALEAARMEGASETQLFWRVVLPSVRPTMAALAVLTFADCWNIVDQAVVFIKDSFAEPLSNLDAKLRTQMRAELTQLHARLGNTFIYVTHDQTEAMTMGERIVVMDKGVIQQVGPPEEVYNTPVNRFVAGFIGTPPMNFLPAKGGGVLGVRPEHVLLCGPDAPGAVDATVALVEFLGAEKLVYLDVDGARIILRTGAETAVEPGQRVFVRWEKVCEFSEE